MAHRGWEKLTDEQLAKDCALPGGYAGGSFDQGWAATRESAEEFVKADPFVLQGVVRNWRILDWNEALSRD
jgi:hypothetical protein